jgi:Flp pilus assembly protein TadG
MAFALLRRLGTDSRGSMAIETALVAPTLIMMTLGIFEVGTVVARQHELQSAANESEIIAVATNRGAETDLNQVKAIIRNSVGLDVDELTITQSFRCGTASQLVANESACDEDDVVSTYLNININESYTPTWTAFGVGRPLDLSVHRTVQIS